MTLQQWEQLIQKCRLVGIETFKELEEHTDNLGITIKEFAAGVTPSSNKTT